MKKIILVALSIPFLTYAQREKLSNKGRLIFETGIEHRITPVYDSGFASVTNNFESFVNPDLQNSGLGLNLGIEYFITNNLSFSLMTTFRYDYVVSGASNIEPNFGVAPDTYGLLLDHHLSLNYHFKVFEKGNFFLSAGFSRINTNSTFTGKKTFFDENNNLIGSIFSSQDSSYWANRYEVGYIFGKSKVGLGVISSNTTNYFPETKSFVVPFAKFSILFGN